MEKLRRERTWDWDISNKKTVHNPVYKESQKWLADKFTDYDYSNDARFETFRDFRKNKQLYQNHKDIAKDYDRKARFYRSCQKMHCSEWNRQMLRTKERFTKLIDRTYASSPLKSTCLQYSYNRWVVKGKTLRESKVGWSAIKAVTDCNKDTVADEELLLPKENEEERICDDCIRSVSVDNVTRETRGLSLLDNIEEAENRKSASVQDMRRPVAGFYRSTTLLKLPISSLGNVQQRS